MIGVAAKDLKIYFKKNKGIFFNAVLKISWDFSKFVFVMTINALIAKNGKYHFEHRNFHNLFFSKLSILCALVSFY